MKLDDIISLADAAQELGIDASGLRAQAAAGRLQARLVGKTWITTRQEVERYRRERLGRVGRPASISAAGAAVPQSQVNVPEHTKAAGAAVPDEA